MTVKLVDRIGRALAGSGVSRRRFLSRVAVVGAAVAVDPIRYAVKPGSAYAQVCGEGASCTSGWTAFCCTVNAGANTCPPGSYVAGWWRIDDSPFCFGAARYVIDCNRSPNATCSCRCADGQCDKRRVCCNNFRYGQCNTQIRGVTEVVCRVVTCTAPWVWDSACSTTVRVDNRTRSHNASCLPGRDATRIDIKYQDMGLVGSILGAPVAAERASGPGRYRRYENGTIYYRASTGALAIHGVMDEHFRTELDGVHGPLGYPLTEPRGTGVGSGLVVRFDGGSIYRSSSSAQPIAVLGAVDVLYRDHDGPSGALGYPTLRETRPDGSQLVRFENGAIAQVAGAPAVEVTSAFLDGANRFADGDVDNVGWPVAPRISVGGAPVQRFEGGIVTVTSGGTAFGIAGELGDAYLETDGAYGRPLRRATSVDGGRARALRLEDALLVAGATGTRLLTGPILDAYEDEGGPEGRLGLPTSSSTTVRTGQRRASFEHGAIVISRDGSVEVLEHRRGRTPDDLATTTPQGGDARTGRRTPDDLAP